jgi:hypothetical protein
MRQLARRPSPSAPRAVPRKNSGADLRKYNTINGLCFYLSMADQAEIPDACRGKYLVNELGVYSDSIEPAVSPCFANGLEFADRVQRPRKSFKPTLKLLVEEPTKLIAVHKALMFCRHVSQCIGDRISVRITKTPLTARGSDSLAETRPPRIRKARSGRGGHEFARWRGGFAGHGYARRGEEMVGCDRGLSGLIRSGAQGGGCPRCVC